MNYVKPKWLYYRFAQVVSWIAATFIFHRKILRNEIKGRKGPFVVVANHECMLDLVSMIGMTHRKMSFVISRAIYSTLPIKGYLEKMGVIPKQQFQTSISDMKRIKAVVKAGEPLVIYPAGLMCEDGLSTPIPTATYRFLQWLGVDVYAARISGSYFVMPKWAKGIRPGRTYMDVYKLFSAEELKTLPEEEIRARTEEAILFDAYREQETHRVKYLGGSKLEGLQNVLYMCPHCKEEFSMTVSGGNTLRCSKCGYEQVSDGYSLLHNEKGIGPEIPYVSDWSRMIYNSLREKISCGEETELSSPVKITMVDQKKKKHVEVGEGHITLSPQGFLIRGRIRGEEVSLEVPIHNVPTLPFKPGLHMDVQNGLDSYRCYPQDGRLVMKFINMVKIFHDLRVGEEAAAV